MPPRPAQQKPFPDETRPPGLIMSDANSESDSTAIPDDVDRVVPGEGENKDEKKPDALKTLAVSLFVSAATSSRLCGDAAATSASSQPQTCRRDTNL